MKNSSMLVLTQKPSFVIANYVLLTFYGYFTIGLTLAVLPMFIHQTLGYNTIIAGGVVSLQYVMTFIMRAYAGKMVDHQGPKRAVMISMSCFIGVGLLLIFAFALAGKPLWSLCLLIISRLLTGCGEGMVGASPVNWAMLRVGEEHTATAISYNGIANYSSMAIAAPLGVWLSATLGNWSLGLLTLAIGFIGFWSAYMKEPLKSASDAPKQPFFKVLKAVSPFGSGLALAGIGFGALSTFVTLYFAAHRWENAATCITTFGLFFIFGRLAFSKAIARHGGIPVAMASIAVECLGLVFISLAASPHVVMLGAALTGLGFALVFPALGVEAVQQVSSANKGAALGAYGLFIDISLGITGPLVGFVAKSYGMEAIFPFSTLMVLGGFFICMALKWRSRSVVRRS
ncbi:MFS transporter [Olivibacter ginsenosidimutans]